MLLPTIKQNKSDCQCIFSLYFAEKLKNALRKFIIPLVYAAKNVHKIAPPHSYIDVRDFKSPKDLAEYLLYLNSNDTEYTSYLSWKKYYTVVKGSRSLHRSILSSL